MRKTPWTEEQDRIRLAMIAEGKSASEIGEALGKSRNSVIGRSRRQERGMDTGNRIIWTPERYAKLERLFCQSYTTAQMAEALECSTHVISRRLSILRQRKQLRGRAKTASSPRPKFTWRNRPPVMSQGEPVSFLDLKSNHCRYIIGPVDFERTMYCGSPAMLGQSWCPVHARVVFSPR